VELKELIRDHDLILDFHNTWAIRSSCAIVWGVPTPRQVAIAAHFGLRRVIEVATPSVSSVKPEATVAIEISRSDSQYPVTYFIDRLRELNLEALPSCPEVAIYMAEEEVLRSTLEELKLPLAGFRSFEIITPNQARRLNLPEEEEFVPALIAEPAYGPDFAFWLLRRVVS